MLYYHITKKENQIYKLKLTAAAALLGLVLAGCTATTPEETDPNTSNPNESTFVSYMRGEMVASADSVLDAETVDYFSEYSDDELVAWADFSCTQISDMVILGEESGLNPTESITNGLRLVITGEYEYRVDQKLDEVFGNLIDEVGDSVGAEDSSEILEGTEYEDSGLANFGMMLSFFTIADYALGVYCPTYKTEFAAAFSAVDSELTEDELPELEQLNLDLSKFVERYTKNGVMISEDGSTLKGYIDLNGNGIIEEGDLIESFQLPEGYAYSEPIGVTPAVGDSYLDGNLSDYSNLTVVEE
jgi:hypothetical protein